MTRSSFVGSALESDGEFSRRADGRKLDWWARSRRAAAMRLFFGLLPGALAFGQAAGEIVTNVQLENVVFYLDQHGDATKLGTLPGPTPTDPQLGSALRRYVIVADVASVGGRPAAGAFLAHGLSAGAAIADYTRNQMHHMVIEIMRPDRTQVGALYGFWMGAGGSAPGAPAGAGVLAILGGTGAYVGVHGQGSNVGSSNLRVASMMEDPSRRRLNGGGRMNLGLHLSGAVSAEVTAVFHADFMPVTTSSPARSGEVLIVRVKAGWPMRPTGQPGEPLRVVAIPVEAVLNDIPAEIVNVVAWPDTSDQYRVDIRMPSGLAPGTANLQVNGAYLPGVAFSLPVR